MRTNCDLRDFVFIFGLLTPLLSLSTTIDVFAQSLETQALIDQLLSVEKNRRTRWFPRAELAREIARDENISPKNRVEALKAVLREELENPCPGKIMADGWYVFPAVYLQTNTSSVLRMLAPGQSHICESTSSN